MAENPDLLTFSLRVHTAEEVYTEEIGKGYTHAAAALNRVKTDGFTVTEKGLKGTEIITYIPYHAITKLEILVAEARIR